MSNLSQQCVPIYSMLADDPDLFEIVKMFVDEMPTRIDRLIAEFNSRDWESLKQTAHQLKGSAGSYGFGEVTPAAGKLEQFLKENLPEEDIQRSLVELIGICRRMSIANPDTK